MANYNTVPTSTNEQDPLLAEKPAPSVKGLLAKSAMASLVLGLIGATAFMGPASPAATTQLADATCNCGGHKSADYCGGYVDAQTISCTSFPVRLTDDNACQDHDAYNSFSAGKFSDGIDSKGFAYGAFAWANMKSIKKGGCDSNYWVIHGCDYTGLQMCDCGGQAGIYIENFGPYTDNCDPNDHYEFRGSEGDWLHPNMKRGLPYPKDDCVWPGCCDGTDNKNEGCTGTYWSDHQKTYFAHPGTGFTYSTYWSGWWHPGKKDATWSDCGVFDDFKPWCNNMVKYDNGDVGPIPEDDDRLKTDCMFAMIYPWVCSKRSDTSASFYWGNEDSWPFGLPYGDETYSVMCYADNEPWSGGHYSDIAPPVASSVEIYYRGLRVTGVVGPWHERIVTCI